MSGNHLLDYYRQAGFEITKSDNSGSNGPCPECGGTDRFVIFHKAGGTRKSAKAPELGSFKCRGCHISGDVIKFMIDFCGFTYPQSLEELGLENPQSTFKPGRRRNRNPPKRQSLPTQKWKIQPEQHADFVEDVGKWREHAEKFVSLCHETLLARQSALDYLAARGVGLEQVKRFRLGYNVGQSSKTKGDYQPAYKQAAAWGMPNLQRPNGSHQKTIALNVGLIIPCYERYDDSGPGGNLLRINIRSFDRGYLISKGSLHFLQAQQVINPGQDVALVVETELDAFALSAILPDVTIIPMGSAGGVPGKAANLELRNKQLILLCLDRDKVGDKQLVRWRKYHHDLPEPVYALGTGVDQAPEKWFSNYPQCQPWYCPHPHKDPGDAIKAGCDMAAWFAEGVAYYSVAASQAVSAAPDMGESRGRGADEAESLLAFAVFWPEHAVKILDSVKVDNNAASVCRLMVDDGVYGDGLLSATEGGLRAKISKILIDGAHCWDWSADPDAYLRRVTKPTPPACPEWEFLIGYLERRQIDIKVIDGEVSLVFTRALGMSAEGELDGVSAALLLDDISGYLGQAKNGVWRAEVFR